MVHSLVMRTQSWLGTCLLMHAACLKLLHSSNGWGMIMPISPKDRQDDYETYKSGLVWHREEVGPSLLMF